MTGIDRLSAIKAHPDEQVRKQYVIENSHGKAVDGEKRTVKFTITTGAIDRDNDTVNPSGWDLKNYLKAPVVLWSHDYSQLPVARTVELSATRLGLEATTQFPPKGVYPFADTVFELIKGGFLGATSVGFRPIEFTAAHERGGIDFKKQELLEFSVVPVPANPEALISAKSKGINVDLITGWAERIMKMNKGAECTKCNGKGCDDCKTEVVEKPDVENDKAALMATRKAVMDALAQVDALIAKSENPFAKPGDEDEEEGEAVKPKSFVLRLSEPRVTSKDVSEAIKGAVKSALDDIGKLVQDETEAALARARGRVD